MRINILIVLIPLLFLNSINYGQVSVDSLERLIANTQGEEQLKLMLRVGAIYINTDPDKSLDLGLKAAFLAKRQGNLSFEGQAILLMGNSSLKIGQHENALRYLNRALAHFEKNNQRALQAEAMVGIAQLYETVNDYLNSLNYLQRAESIYRQLGRKKLQIEMHQRIGDIAIKIKNFHLAQKEYTNALKLLETEGGENAQPNTAFILGRIGFLYRNLGQLHESVDAFMKSSDIYQKLQMPREYAQSLSEIGLSYQAMRKTDSSFFYYSKALSHFQLKNDTLSTIELLQNIGDVFFDKQQYFQAVSSYNQSYQLAIRKNRNPSQVAALVSISRCHSALGDYNLSTEYLNRALALAKKENLTTSAAEVYRYLSKTNEASGKFVQALEYYKLWSDIRDSLNIEETGKNLARIQILYDISQKERENEILKQNNQIQELLLTKTRYQRLGFIVLALFLFALLIMLGLVLRTKQKEYAKQKEVEQEITEINKSLEKRMIAEIKKQEKQQMLLSQKSKLESLGTLAAGIAHEINQPLGGISMGLDNILFRLNDKSLSDDYLKEKVSVLFENVERIKKIIEHVRTFSRTQKPTSFDRIQINDVVNNALSMVKTQFESHRIRIDVSLAQKLTKVIGDKYKIEQVLLNLLGNARHAVDEKEEALNDSSFIKKIKISTYEDETNVYVKVTDNGVGINSRVMDKIFDPFFTTKKDDKGTGLGLSISYGIIKDLLGDIKVESKEGEFSAFEVVIPKT